ncbi:MAG: replicative DNA helicase [Rhodospirillaceae bacterium]|nr:replicative DNA helicase [Rhodospirillaceae bacterium]|tara:strand:+ start:284 stop:1819 length:1536 start_codon:yes stop_codon:yes gene_type:complete
MASSIADISAGTQDRESAGYRTPPHNIEAEQALLGAILVNNDAFHKVSGYLRPDHFFVPVHGRIFTAAETLIGRGQIANPVTLKSFFDRDESLADIGGAQYLARLAGSVVSIVNADDYGHIIHDLALRRGLISLGEDVVNDAYDPRIDAAALDQIEVAEHRLFELAETGESERGFKAIKESLIEAIASAERALNRAGQLAGVSTGLIDMDRLLGGLHSSDLVILAGRPSMGKTALATTLAFNAARARAEWMAARGGKADPRDPQAEGAVVGFFSLEMSAEQLAGRILAETAGIPSDQIRKGKLSNDEFVKLVKASQELYEVPLFIDDTPALSIGALRTRARRLKRTENLSLVVVDYLQLLRASGRTENRVQEISEITQGLKALAKELDLPVLALSQLSRQVEQREDKRPQLSDLRESGSIEQDADVVMFVYREEYYAERSEPNQRPDEADDKFSARYDRWLKNYEASKGLADVLIAKQRHGPIGNVRLRFEAETTRFENYQSADHLPDAFP